MGEKQAEKARMGADNRQEDTVRLKPIMGLRPGIYLAVIYSVILLAILFFILVYPGLVRPGSVVVLKTEPAGAALRVDGVYRGTAPDTVFVSRGKHTLELVLPGFTAKRIECDIPGRLLFSALFPRRYPLEVTLTAVDPAAAFIPAAKDYAEWTFGGEPTAAWQVPLSLSEGAYRAGVAAASRPGAWKPEEILKASARFAVTGAALRDLLRAKVIADNGGLPPSPLSLTRSASDIIGFLSENPGSAVWLAETLPAESAVLLTASSWYQAQLAAFTTAEESLSPPPALSSVSPPAGYLAVGGLSFTGMAGGTLVQGEPFPHAVPVEGFMISDIEVPSSLFAEFLADSPRWRADQREALAAEDLVTGDYLVDYGTAAVGPGAGVTGVSWYAARAFCEWFGKRLPPSMNAYEVRLPAEAEWEYAAKSAKRWAVTSEIKHMEDSAWEWCLDPYVPLPFINAAPDGIAAIGSPERSLRGGSPLNPAGSVTSETRASLPPAFCSPFVSFRVVIAPAAGGQGTTGFPAQPAVR
jgi:formylglycine-generating enzyme required for sulfatase activity